MTSPETPPTTRATATVARQAKEEADAKVQQLRAQLAEEQKEWAAKEASIVDQIERAEAHKRKCDEDDAGVQWEIAASKRRRLTAIDAASGEHYSELQANKLETSDQEADLEAQVQAMAAALTLEMRDQLSPGYIGNAEHQTHSICEVQKTVFPPQFGIPPAACAAEVGGNANTPAASVVPTTSAAGASFLRPQSSATASVVEALQQLRRSPFDVESDDAVWQQPCLGNDDLEQLGRHLAMPTPQSSTAASSFEETRAVAEHIANPASLPEAAAERPHVPELVPGPSSSAPCMSQCHDCQLAAELYVPSASAPGRLEGPFATLPPHQLPHSQQQQRQRQQGSAEVPIEEAEVASSRVTQPEVPKLSRRRVQWQDPEPPLMTGKRDRRTSVRVKKYNEEAYGAAIGLAGLRRIPHASSFWDPVPISTGSGNRGSHTKHVSMSTLTDAGVNKDKYVPRECRLMADRGAVHLRLRSGDLQAMGSRGGIERMLTVTGGGHVLQIRIDRDNNLRAGWAALRLALGITSTEDIVTVRCASPEEEQKASATDHCMFHFMCLTAGSRAKLPPPVQELRPPKPLQPVLVSRLHNTTRSEANRRRRERRRQLKEEACHSQQRHTGNTSSAANNRTAQMTSAAALGAVSKAPLLDALQQKSKKSRSGSRRGHRKGPPKPLALPVPEGLAGIKCNVRGSASHRLYISAAQTLQLVNGKRRPDVMMVVAEHPASDDQDPREIGRAYVENRSQPPHQKPGIETVTGWSTINGRDGCIDLEDYSIVGIYPSLDVEDTFHVVKLKAGPCAWGLSKETVAKRPDLSWCHCIGPCTCRRLGKS